VWPLGPSDKVGAQTLMTAKRRGAKRRPAEKPVRQGDALVGGRSAVRPALGYDLGAREEADAVLAILVKVAES
jgi:hypothetical protein